MLRPVNHVLISHRLTRLLLEVSKPLNRDEKRIVGKVIFDAIDKLRTKVEWNRQEISKEREVIDD